MPIWEDYITTASEEHTAVGKLRLLRGVYSPQLNNKRHVVVHLPPSYHSDYRRTYPVIYMHDGQNLFDAATSYVGEWQVDETMQTLATEGLEAIIVGIYNQGSERIMEYNPFNDARFGQGRGREYLRFITETLKPTIDHDFRTRREREHTAILGSSMGGLISLYGFFRFPQTFGMAGVMSPALWLARGAIVQDVIDAPLVTGRLYLDVGTREMSPWQNTTKRGDYCISPRCMAQLLRDKGYGPEALLYVEEAGAAHNEEAWARRLPNALRFLLCKP